MRENILFGIGAPLEEKFDLRKFIDPLSVIFVQMAVISSAWILFKLTLFDILIILCVDFICLFVTMLVEKNILRKMIPELAHLYPVFDSSIFRAMGTEERVKIFRALQEYPRVKVIETFVGSFIKVIPAFILIVFYFDKSGSPLWLSIGKFWILESLYVFLIFEGLVYTVTSSNVFSIFDSLSKKFDLSEVIENLPITKNRNDLFVVENVALFASITALVILVWFTSQMEFRNKDEFLITFTIVMLGGLISLGRVYYMNRKSFLNGIKTVFEHLDDIKSGSLKVIPLHSDSTLRNFEQTFNALVKKLHIRDREIESWMALQAEQNKMARVGELISLVTHDMVSPLHTIKFCLDEMLEEQLEADEVRDYLEQMSLNLSRVNDMVDTVKYSLKNPRGSELESSLFEGYGYTMQLLKSHFKHGLNVIEFNFDPSLVSVKCKLSHTNIVHLFHNIIKNSIENLVENNIDNPSIDIVKLDSQDDEVVFMIKDNGTGLSLEDFNVMTTQDSLIDTRKGLGIRLTKRMLEKYHGDMTIIETENDFGTNILITLPRSS